MNATLDLLRTRRSVPPLRLEEPGPNPAELDTILTLASRVPDHGKLAPWRFLVIAGEARTRIGATIAEAYAADHPEADAVRLDLERNRLALAPLVVAVVSRAGPHIKIPEWEQVLSAGAVSMNLVVAANAAGFATAWLTEWFAYDRRILDVLGLEPRERLAGFIHIGRPQEVPPDRPRPALADIVTRL
ncbi:MULTISPECIES: nitroreductase [unclassified Methylobacterium]|uniref:nitroreductase family protein n=1 Tax=unclassified Methylobacterium TaxID=2615210 RepID=UPI0006FE737C|nr:MULTISPECIES: nitroreductase [unclassified Methylobacterium]KQP80549.1 NAD(P)H nitroreductase [Methylobacterium sp. Leaf117]KQP87303.1 NAD(P)H nitroreductase [Methylobacterium sp. Leaf113]MCK2055678.1 nitroreductase [Methylobacterium sp. 37f]